MANFVKKKYIKYFLGDKNIRSHIDAIHACPPKADEFTGEIVEAVVKKINCSGIISIVPRTEADLNRPQSNNNKEAIDEYRQTIKEILDQVNILSENGEASRPYLHLAIHGMRNRQNDIAIGTRHGSTCSKEIRIWFIKEIKKHVKKLDVDKRFPGDPSKKFHRLGDQNSNYIGYGRNFNTFQIEISRTLREKHRAELVDMFCDFIESFNKEFS
jgi:DNA-directed RNA polymerase subunit F